MVLRGFACSNPSISRLAAHRDPDPQKTPHRTGLPDVDGQRATPAELALRPAPLSNMPCGPLDLFVQSSSAAIQHNRHTEPGVSATDPLPHAETLCTTFQAP